MSLENSPPSADTISNSVPAALDRFSLCLFRTQECYMRRKTAPVGVRSFYARWVVVVVGLVLGYEDGSIIAVSRMLHVDEQCAWLGAREIDSRPFRAWSRERCKQHY